jgi:NADH-quinone oxidoreductase subunit E
MSDSVNLIRQWVSQEGLDEIDRWVQKYPPSQKCSAVMRALMVIQEATGFLTQTHMDTVASYLEMPAIVVYEVASFYTMYEKKPVGRNLISVCTNISCKLRNSDAIVHALENKLGVSLGETTSDGRFTLRGVECLGACVNAPMMQVNKVYHENLTADHLDAVLEQYE